MNWDVFLDLGEWAGAIAVFVTLIYLVKQVSLHANQLEKQVQTDLDAMTFSAYDPIYQGRNAEIMVKGLHHAEELTETESYIFNLLMYRHAHVMLNVGQRTMAKEIPEYLIATYSDHYRDVLVDTPGGKAWIEQHKKAHWRDSLRALGLDTEFTWTA